MPRVFISYRREDTPGSAGRLYDSLQQAFGRENVFMDVDTLAPGEDFVEAIQARLVQCDVVLAVIGRRWLSLTDANERRRLDDEADYLRIEIQAAIDREVRLVPVLVERAPMPMAHDLPEPLRPLARRQAFELRDTRWVDDTSALIRAIAPAELVPDRARPRWVLGAAALALLTIVGVGVLASRYRAPAEPELNAAAEPGFNAPAEPVFNAPAAESIIAKMQSDCEAGRFDTCKDLGVAYYNGRAVAKDDTRAVTLYSKACDGGNMAGCFELGAMYADGSGAPKNEQRAVALYRKACDGGDPGGCLNLGYMYSMGLGVDRDIGKARPLYERACNGGEPIGCRNLGQLYAGGKGGLKRDRARATSLYQQACKGGDDPACLLLREGEEAR